MDDWTDMIKKELDESKETRKKEMEMLSKEVDMIQQRWNTEKKQRETQLQLMAAIISKLN